jgi:enoyl-CoA hydratase/carnithine racemase
MSEIEVTRADGVVTITLNVPAKKNAVTTPMFARLGELFTEVARDEADRVLVITGAGGAFCSGADLTAISSVTSSGMARMRMIGSAALALHRIPKPTIAKVGGVAAGAGCNLALGCDLIIASHDARFSEIFAKRGLSLDFGGSWLLPRLVGMHKAKELAFLADVISAQEAERIGIVNRVVPADELDAVVDALAARLAAGPATALSLTKTMLNNAFAVSFDQAIEDEARAQNVNFAGTDMAEAMTAFAERREPRFTG